jgi:hypothetical protein
VENRQELDGVVESWTMQYTPYQIMLILQRQGIAAGARDLYDTNGKVNAF